MATRQITVFRSNGVGQPITIEHEPEISLRRVLGAAEELLHSNGLWPPSSEIELPESWSFDVEKALKLQDEINRAKTILTEE